MEDIEKTTVGTNDEVEETAVGEEPIENAEVTTESDDASQGIVEQTEQVRKVQTKEENAAFARARRERERKAEIEKAREDAKRDAKVQSVIDLVGTNPYTNKPIKTAEDAEQYLLMRQIDKDGGEPLTDYAAYVDKREQERKAEVQRQEDEQNAIRNDIANFRNAHPDINLDNLLQDQLFAKICGKELGSVPLNDAYQTYVDIMKKVRQDVQNEIVAETAKKQSGTGSLANTSESVGVTKEQFRKMSYDQRAQLYKENPALYKRLTTN